MTFTLCYETFCISISGGLNSRTSQLQRFLLPVIWDPTERSNTLWETTRRARYTVADNFLQQNKICISNRPNEGNQIVFGIEYTECQAFCPVVRPGSPSPPHPQTSFPPPPLGPRGEAYSLAEVAVGVPDSDGGTDTLVLYYNPSTVFSHTDF